MAAIGSTQEQRVVLKNISWETYQRLLADHENSSAPRFTYDRGVLEIMSPLPQHERYKRAIESLMDVLALERGIGIDSSFGSTTFRRAESGRGFEPDACFYIQHAPMVRGKERLDLDSDPPPDIVVEIEITSPAIDKLPIYAQFGVPEVWRYNGDRLQMLGLQSGQYVERDSSNALPGLAVEDISRILEESKSIERVQWLRRVRTWARQGKIGS
jgi:Uma2 family endonuclease